MRVAVHGAIIARAFVRIKDGLFINWDVEVGGLDSVRIGVGPSREIRAASAKSPR